MTAVSTEGTRSRWARYFNPLRLASYLLVLFCLGHSFGALIAAPQFGPQADAVFSAMKSVHFQCETTDCTWYGFYLGFGWIVSAFFLFSATVAWFLGGMLIRDQRALAPVIWALFLSYVATAVMSWRYFFIEPRVLSTVIAALLGFQSLRLRKLGQ